MDIIPRTQKQTARKSTGAMPRILKPLANPTAPPQIKRKRKDRVGSEIKKQLKTTDPSIPMLPFKRLVMDILKENNTSETEFKIRYEALECLRVVGEEYVGKMFFLSQLAAGHRRGTNTATLEIKDIKFINEITRWNGMGMKYGNLPYAAAEK